MTTKPTSEPVIALVLVVRPGVADDLGYVIDTWGRSLRGEYPDARTTDFVDGVRRGIDRRLRDGAKVFVVHPNGESDLILGWACVDGPIVHYVYVRQAYRRLGVARRLIDEIGYALPLHVDAITDDLRAIKRAHPEAIRYLPNP